MPIALQISVALISIAALVLLAMAVDEGRMLHRKKRLKLKYLRFW